LTSDFDGMKVLEVPMQSKPKRPASVWIAQAVLVFLTIVGLYDSYSMFNVLSYYGLGAQLWIQFGFWFNIAMVIVSPITFLGMTFRLGFSRWLAAAIFFTNVVESFRTFLFQKINWNSLEVIGYFVSYTVIALPFFYLGIHILVSKRVRDFFGKMNNEVVNAQTSPPPPPTFDS